jgi:hypothetical protein
MTFLLWTALPAPHPATDTRTRDDRVDALAYVVRLAVERLAKVRAMRLLLSQPVALESE